MSQILRKKFSALLRLVGVFILLEIGTLSCFRVSFGKRWGTPPSAIESLSNSVVSFFWDFPLPDFAGSPHANMLIWAILICWIIEIGIRRYRSGHAGSSLSNGES